MKDLLAVMIMMMCVSSTYGQIRITGYQVGLKTVVLKNFGGASVDVSSYELSSMMAYAPISTMTIISGSTTIPAGGELVFTSSHPVQFLGGDVGLFNSATHDAATIVDFMQYCSLPTCAADFGDAAVAVTANKWTAMTFANAFLGPDLEFFGTSTDTGAAFWRLRVATTTVVTTAVSTTLAAGATNSPTTSAAPTTKTPTAAPTAPTAAPTSIASRNSFLSLISALLMIFVGIY